ncbi:hypothetical protein FHL15_005962 [Xylaria flabelliformis]|uniref:HTH APSES-type domain-containing protein n=1 Tax=Xylaria flabelliformis TaxID=2512241 RepID=A0A553HYT3_9PEZI|nr:hypothetical protein FHL15_005962 [Xylaria flabelliformis]
MLSLSSLLNPAPPGSSFGTKLPPSPESSSPTDSCGEDSMFLDRPTMPKQKMPKDAAIFTKSKPKGAINFHPYEDLDEVSLHRVRRFQVHPLGKIREYSRHIPYNSGKKDFFEKTGRESFEVFQYVFKVPGNDVEYAVMWDYNIGLVRMTPFFKCCKYPKTTPAKMLNSNPGLKEITHSITGGSIMAQGEFQAEIFDKIKSAYFWNKGYWMPYQCAKAVCATFCCNISGAMIPIFGPDFPVLCTQVNSPEYGRMIIDPAIIIRSTREAEYYRHVYSNTASGNDSPKRSRRVFRNPYDGSGHHSQYRIQKPCISTPGSENSPYTTDTDGETSTVTDRTDLTRGSPHPRLSLFLHSPTSSMITTLRSSQASSGSSRWTPVNVPHPLSPIRPQDEHHTSGPSPWLSAIPRFTTTAHLQASSYPNANEQKPPRSQPYSAALSPSGFLSKTHHSRIVHRQQSSPSDAPPHSFQRIPHQPLRVKRPAAQIEEDASLDDQYSRTPLRQDEIPQGRHMDKENHANTQPINWRGDDKVGGGSNAGADKRAALLLMNLSVRDRSIWKSPRACREAEGPNTSRVHDVADDRYGGNGTNRCANVDSLDRDNSSKGGYNCRNQVSAGTTIRIRGDGVSSEMASPSNGVFPRIKRVRSNSM